MTVGGLPTNRTVNGFTVNNGATAVATIVPNTAGVAHVILAVTDNGTPSLTSYRRAILTVQGPGR